MPATKRPATARSTLSRTAALIIRFCFFADRGHFSVATYFLQGAILSAQGAARNIW
ncbi:hypothetical protein [Cupriavidus taiwanensis]|nr:hypothetical protein [Cupriavidus taiwanensis]